MFYFLSPCWVLITLTEPNLTRVCLCYIYYNNVFYPKNQWKLAEILLFTLLTFKYWYRTYIKTYRLIKDPNYRTAWLFKLLTWSSLCGRPKHLITLKLIKTRMIIFIKAKLWNKDDKRTLTLVECKNWISKIKKKQNKFVAKLPKYF